MRVEQFTIHPDQPRLETAPHPQSQCVLVFGARDLCTPVLLAGIEAVFPNAEIVGCSTAGEICGGHVDEGSVVITSIEFEHSSVAATSGTLSEGADASRALGRQLAEQLPAAGLRHVLVLSEGLAANGSDLVAGLESVLPSEVTVTGGLAGDGGEFVRTTVIHGALVRDHAAVALGLYGEALEIGCGSLGGFDPFGPERLVTRSEGNTLYELDGRPALDLYKTYLGEHAAELPATGLLFPLAVRSETRETPVARSLLAVDEATGSMTFAGDVPQHSLARLMRASCHNLVAGAAGAAKRSRTAVAEPPELAILISCVGRKMALKQRVEEEVEAVLDELGSSVPLCGFYSYGEISPSGTLGHCDLHNQTMTITAIREHDL